MENISIGFIGGGNIAYAIGKGLVASGLVKPNSIWASRRSEQHLSSVWGELGCHCTTSNVELVNHVDIVFLCVKPHLFSVVLAEISVHTRKKQIFVSVAAGVTLSSMEQMLPEGSKVMRTMPNTPCLIQSGVVLTCPGSLCTEEDAKLVEGILSTTGMVERVEENQIDSMASLMGCSIAWYYMVLEAMGDGGVKVGVSHRQAQLLAAKAMEGAAKMMLVTGKHPGQLKDEVTSPNGSTICGVYELEQAGMRGMFMRAVDAATKRNRELGQS